MVVDCVQNLDTNRVLRYKVTAMLLDRKYLLKEEWDNTQHSVTKNLQKHTAAKGNCQWAPQVESTYLCSRRNVNCRGSLGAWSKERQVTRVKRGSGWRVFPTSQPRILLWKQLEDTELFLLGKWHHLTYFSNRSTRLLSKDPLGQEQENWHPHRRSDCHRSHQFSSLAQRSQQCWWM